MQVDSVRKLTLVETPPVLAIQLKRFQHAANGTVTKLDRPVTIPATLTLGAPTVTVETKYRLVGVIVHRGQSPSSGHYIALTAACGTGFRESNDEFVRDTYASVHAWTPASFIGMHGLCVQVTDLSGAEALRPESPASKGGYLVCLSVTVTLVTVYPRIESSSLCP